MARKSSPEAKKEMLPCFMETTIAHNYMLRRLAYQGMWQLRSSFSPWSPIVHHRSDTELQ